MYLTIFGKPRYLGLVTAEDDIRFDRGERLLVETSRGVETAVVAGEITERQESLYRSIDNRQEGQSGNDSGLQNIAYIRNATESDIAADKENRLEEDRALIVARQVLSRHALEMKLVDVEYMIDRKKLFLYFTSEQRVDFRAYVRDLAREFRTRIELRQIGVRDEAKVVKGIGSCGRTCCCSYWLQRFSPIGIKMVKEQNLALNPTKISGLCGRLMCCMSYEQETYHGLWSQLPAHGSKIRTENGTYVLIGVDLAANSCTLHGPEGNVCVNVSLFQKFKETVLAGGTWNNEDWGCDDRGRIIDAGRLDGTCRAGCEVSCAACRADRGETPLPERPEDVNVQERSGRSEKRSLERADGQDERPYRRRERGPRGGQGDAAEAKGEAHERRKPAEKRPRDAESGSGVRSRDRNEKNDRSERPQKGERGSRKNRDAQQPQEQAQEQGEKGRQGSGKHGRHFPRRSHGDRQNDPAKQAEQPVSQ